MPALRTSQAGHALFRCRPLDWFERALDRDRLGQREVLAHGILGELAAHNGIEIHHGDGDVGPAEQTGGGEAAVPRDESVIGPDHDGLQQAELGHAGSEAGDVAHVLAVALADDDGVDRKRLTGRRR